MLKISRGSSFGGPLFRFLLKVRLENVDLTEKLSQKVPVLVFWGGSHLGRAGLSFWIFGESARGDLLLGRVWFGRVVILCLSFVQWTLSIILGWATRAFDSSIANQFVPLSLVVWWDHYSGLYLPIFALVDWWDAFGIGMKYSSVCRTDVSSQTRSLCAHTCMPPLFPVCVCVWERENESVLDCWERGRVKVGLSLLALLLFTPNFWKSGVKWTETWTPFLHSLGQTDHHFNFNFLIGA